MLVNLITSSWCHVIAQAYRMDSMNVITMLWYFCSTIKKSSLYVARKLWLRNIRRAERRRKKKPNGKKSLIIFFRHNFTYYIHTILNCPMAYILLPFHIYSIRNCLLHRIKCLNIVISLYACCTLNNTTFCTTKIIIKSIQIADNVSSMCCLSHHRRMFFSFYIIFMIPLDIRRCRNPSWNTFLP